MEAHNIKPFVTDLFLFSIVSSILIHVPYTITFFFYNQIVSHCIDSFCLSIYYMKNLGYFVDYYG